MGRYVKMGRCAQDFGKYIHKLDQEIFSTEKALWLLK